MELNLSWFDKLKNQRLSRQDRQTVRRFLSEPNSRLFLSVAEILKTYDQHQECISLLEYGLNQHTNYGAARVILAREHFDQGNFSRAQDLLINSPVSLHQNRLAQKMLFKSCIVLGLYPEADQALLRLRAMDGKDDEINQASDTIDLYGHSSLRKKILERFATVLEGNLATKKIETSNETHVNDKARDTKVSAAGLQELLNRIDLSSIGNYKVEKLSDVYQGQVSSIPDDKNHNGLSFELDSTTLADIFAAQGHYRRALTIYRRLVKLAPNNVHLRNKVKELAILMESQKNDDYNIDPDTIEKMENLDGIDRQIDFLQGMLDSLKQ